MAARGEVAFRNRSVSQSRFAMVPRSDVPRSRFQLQFTHKTTFDADRLIPVYVQEILPGDQFRVNMTAFARLSTPLFPIMDNLHLDSFFFFVPNRLVWSNWARFMGERDDPDDTIDYLVPQLRVSDGNIPVGSVLDYMGIPTGDQITSDTLEVNAMPVRGYYLIYNEWFRDQNLQDSAVVSRGDGPDVYAGSAIQLMRRGKRHDYFTSCLPWPQKGESVQVPLGTEAPIRGLIVPDGYTPTTLPVSGFNTAGETESFDEWIDNAVIGVMDNAPNPGYRPTVYADLTEAAAATVNTIRQAFQIQKLLERDARGGTRYTELLLAHFGVQPQDSRLQRPEYLGGGSTPVNINPVAQQSATGIDGSASPLGSLGAVGTSVARHGFSAVFQEHGFVIGMVNVRADLTYQQGIHKMWDRRTRYDYYWPAFAHLGEQAVLRREIYATGDEEDDAVVFGYQERWSEYRYYPSMISGLFRSTATGAIDEWHAAQLFGSAPVLGSTFIEARTPMDRILAAGSEAANQQILFDSVFDVSMVRAMPTYSVPGFIDRF